MSEDLNLNPDLNLNEERWAERLNEGYVVDVILQAELLERYPNLKRYMDVPLIDEY